MNTTKSTSIEKIGLQWGLITLGLLGAFFLIMKFAGLIHVPELRILNAVIMFYGVFQAISQAKAELSGFNYFKGMGAGILTSLVAAFSFSIFGIIYLTLIDPSFLNSIQANEPLGIYMNEYSASLQIFIEGSASGVLLSFASMQWLKIPHLAGGE